MSKPIGIAIIGTGYWGVNYIRVFSELADAEVIAICDQRESRLNELKRRFPGIILLKDLDELLRLPEVDAVIVCTPAVTHFEIARRILMTGRHVLVEKPITTTSVEAEELGRIADSRRLALMVGHTFLFHPAIRKIKEYLQHGDAGRIYYLYSRRTNMGPIRTDVSAIWDLAPHDVSIFNYLLDSTPEWVSGIGANVIGNDHQDVGFLSLGYSSNIVGHIHVSWADAYKVREVVVVGSEKRIVFNDFNPSERVRVFEKGVALAEPEASTYGEFQLRVRDGDIISPRVDSSEPLKNECSEFLECLRFGTHPFSDAHTGSAVVRVMEAVDLSIARHGAPVEICSEKQYA